MGRPYTQHGSRHGPNGSDPIIGASGLSWAYISGSSGATDCPPSSSTPLAADEDNFYTNASDTFDTDDGLGTMGVRILADGHYMFWMTAQPNGANSHAGDDYRLVVFGGGEYPDASLNGPNRVISQVDGWDEFITASGLMAVGDFITAPTDPITCAIDTGVNGGNTMKFYYSGLVVVQLDTVPTDLD